MKLDSVPPRPEELFTVTLPGVRLRMLVVLDLIESIFDELVPCARRFFPTLPAAYELLSLSYVLVGHWFSSVKEARYSESTLGAPKAFSPAGVRGALVIVAR